MVDIEQEAWGTVLAAVGSGSTIASGDPVDQDAEWFDLYGPLIQADGCFVVAHLAQSLDGFVALSNGESQWISSFPDVVHTHRLRALVDAVVVGVQTVLDDDPRLTVRHCEGDDPVRVILDPHGRAPELRKVFTDSGSTLRICTRAERPGDVELPADGGVFDPEQVLAALQARGLRKVLVEGGGVTVSHFLTANCVDRLHLVVAPVLLGGGRPAFPRPLVHRLAEAQRLTARPRALGTDWLFDCEMR